MLFEQIVKVIALCSFTRWRSPLLGFRENGILVKFFKNESPMLLSHQIWQQFKTYCTLFIYKMAVAAILDYVKLL